MKSKIVVKSPSTGATYIMTEDQIEAAYRYQEHQYLIEDAKNQLELNADWIEDRYDILTTKLSELQKNWANDLKRVAIAVFQRMKLGML